MEICDEILQESERIVFGLRRLYAASGYRPYRMSKFEEYDLYADNKDFLVSDRVLTFTDTDGKLMALKPDVTLSIIKNSPDEKEKVNRVYYNENIYRISKGTGFYREIMQVGAECFGNVGEKEIAETVLLAAKSLLVLSDRAVLALSDLSVLESAVSALLLPAEKEKALFRALGDGNRDEAERLLENADPARADALLRLFTAKGTLCEVLPVLAEFEAAFPSGALSRFRAFLEKLQNTEFAPLFRVDFSIVGDLNYYNGIVFRGYLPSLSDAVLSGGQYDRLMEKLGRLSHAIGFAVYTDELEHVSGNGEPVIPREGWINVALPKGRLGEKVYGLFERAGFPCPALLDPGRKLVFENAEKRIRYFWVKPTDVAIYVERGAADVGVAGKDILEESDAEVYELLDLKCGKCRMAVAAPESFADTGEGTLRVATKFPAVARRFYRSKGREIDIIKLNGSIEIAPLLGLSDVIVDIVETGSTLRENHLAVVEEVFPISARFIANKSACKFKNEQIETIVKGLRALIGEEK